MSATTPSDFLPQLVAWSTFNLFTTCSLVVLLGVTLFLQGLTANSTLLNLEFIFIIVSSTNSALIWTGHALDPEPPFALCLLNASATMSNTPLTAGAAVAIVAKVWGTAMMFWLPQCRPVMLWIIWPPFLLLFPYLLSIPVFVAGLVIGLKDRTTVYRASPFYCVVDSAPIQTTSSLLGAVFAFVSLVLAAWTTIKMFQTRRRAGTRLADDPNVSYAFAFRVLLFSGFVGAAFVAGIVSLTSTFEAVIPDIIVASCGVGAFFIFASSKPIIRFVFSCKRDPATPSYGPSTTTTTLSWRSRYTDPPQEYTLDSVTSPTKAPMLLRSFNNAESEMPTRGGETPGMRYMYPWDGGHVAAKMEEPSFTVH
ncbi:hypothetical protein C8R46DRAFT_1351443 [Mycena filopes]|nr:hypothetical protein C8R46DRAFT_1351443 [Mycena filopes]